MQWSLIYGCARFGSVIMAFVGFILIFFDRVGDGQRRRAVLVRGFVLVSARFLPATVASHNDWNCFTFSPVFPFITSYKYTGI